MERRLPVSTCGGSCATFDNVILRRRAASAKRGSTGYEASIALARLGRKIGLEFSLHVAVRVGVLRRRLLDRDIRPLLGVFAVDLQPFLEAGLRVRLDRLDRTLGFAHAAVDT